MVEEIELHGKTYYLCLLCRTPYLEWDWAQSCEAFCAKYNACSIDITEHAASSPEMEEAFPKER